ncbi:hypothetical protein ACHAXS_012514 [Conticribra weissflogii]
MCMEILQGITTKEGVSNDYLLQLISNLYEQKQADKVWNQYLEVELLTGGFTQSLIDECVFFKGPNLPWCNDLLCIRFDIEHQGHPSNYFGVNIKHFQDGSYEFTQQALIEVLLDDVGMASLFKIKRVAMSSSK